MIIDEQLELITKQICLTKRKLLNIFPTNVIFAYTFLSYNPDSKNLPEGSPPKGRSEKGAVQFREVRSISEGCCALRRGFALRTSRDIGTDVAELCIEGTVSIRLMKRPSPMGDE